MNLVMLSSSTESSPPESRLRSGVGIAEITPSLDVGILMSSIERRYAPFEGVRLPLYARAVLLEQDHRRVAMVSLELLGLDSKSIGGIRQFKERVVAASGDVLSADELILASTHTHSAPESIGLSDLSLEECFQTWINALARQIGAALRDAAASLQPCRLVADVRSAPGLGIHRRIKTTQGIVLSHLKPLPEIIISQDGAIDDRVFMATLFDLSDRPLAMLINATCHPVHEMCIPQVSSDFPGEMSRELERRHPGLVALFFNGAAGNINPPTVSGGPANARRHGLRLAELVDNTIPGLQPVDIASLDFCWREVSLPARDALGQPTGGEVQATLAAVRIGKAAFVFLPGEPFVETALAIRDSSPWLFTAVVGYAENYIGYIPTNRAFEEGGYEIGPGQWCRVDRGSEPLVRSGARELLWRMHARDRTGSQLAESSGSQAPVTPASGPPE